MCVFAVPVVCVCARARVCGFGHFSCSVLVSWFSNVCVCVCVVVGEGVYLSVFMCICVGRVHTVSPRTAEVHFPDSGMSAKCVRVFSAVTVAGLCFRDSTVLDIVGRNGQPMANGGGPWSSGGVSRYESDFGRPLADTRARVSTAHPALGPPPPTRAGGNSFANDVYPTYVSSRRAYHFDTRMLPPPPSPLQRGVRPTETRGRVATCKYDLTSRPTRVFSSSVGNRRPVPVGVELEAHRGPGQLLCLPGDSPAPCCSGLCVPVPRGERGSVPWGPVRERRALPRSHDKCGETGGGSTNPLASRAPPPPPPPPLK